LEVLLDEVFAEAVDEGFVVDYDDWVAEASAFAEYVLFDLIQVFLCALVYVDVFVLDAVVFEVLFGHFAPCACAQRVQEDSVLGVFSGDFLYLHVVFTSWLGVCGFGLMSDITV